MKRSYGTGSLMQKHGAWYGRWRLSDGRRLSRRVGPVRAQGSDLGLTRREAEAQLRKLMLAEEVSPTPKAAARHTVDDAALALIERKRVQGVSRSYLQTLSSAQRCHFGPEIGAMVLRKVHRRDVEAMSARLLSRGLAPKTVANTLKILHGVFEHAIDLEWTNDNPVRRAARPRHVRDTDPDLRFLTLEELEAVLRAIPDEVVVREPAPFRAGRRGPAPPPPPDVLGPVLRVLVLTAAFTGLRQGDCSACAGATSTGPFSASASARRGDAPSSPAAASPTSPRAGRCRWPTASWPSSTPGPSAPSTPARTTSSSSTRSSARRSTARRSPRSSRTPAAPPASASSASTTCAIRSRRAWPRQAHL